MYGEMHEVTKYDCLVNIYKINRFCINLHMSIQKAICVCRIVLWLWSWIPVHDTRFNLSELATFSHQLASNFTDIYKNSQKLKRNINRCTTRTISVDLFRMANYGPVFETVVFKAVFFLDVLDKILFSRW